MRLELWWDNDDRVWCIDTNTDRSTVQTFATWQEAEQAVRLHIVQSMCMRDIAYQMEGVKL